MRTITISQPNASQEKLLLARTKHVGFGGARGGGKSWAVRLKAKLLALRGWRMCDAQLVPWESCATTGWCHDSVRIRPGWCGTNATLRGRPMAAPTRV